jgi:hypothetical protein
MEQIKSYSFQLWYWVWTVPILIALIQSALLFSFFNFETPYSLKRSGDFENLSKLLSKIYVDDQI